MPEPTNGSGIRSVCVRTFQGHGPFHEGKRRKQTDVPATNGEMEVCGEYGNAPCKVKGARASVCAGPLAMESWMNPFWYPGFAFAIAAGGTRP